MNIILIYLNIGLILWVLPYALNSKVEIGFLYNFLTTVFLYPLIIALAIYVKVKRLTS